jgi:hypothetical protein
LEFPYIPEILIKLLLSVEDSQMRLNIYTTSRYEDKMNANHRFPKAVFFINRDRKRQGNLNDLRPLIG